jgi:cytochrome c
MVASTFVMSLAAAAQAGPGPASKTPSAYAHCAACHTDAAGAPSAFGPNLYGVIGNRAGSRPGYAYSPALAQSKLVWSKASLARFIANPAMVVPGTRMPNPGVSAAADRAAIVAYLAGQK